MKRDTSLLRQNEAWELLRAIQDPVTDQLLNRAVFYITKRFTSGQNPPVADLDLRFLVEALEEFFRDQGVLKRILSGEDLRLWTKNDDL